MQRLPAEVNPAELVFLQKVARLHVLLSMNEEAGLCSVHLDIEWGDTREIRNVLCFGLVPEPRCPERVLTACAAAKNAVRRTGKEGVG